MKRIKTVGILSFIGLMSFGVASCFNPSGPGGGTGTPDTVRHGKLPVDTVIHRDTLIRNDTIKPPPPPPPPPPPDSGRLDSTLLDSLLGHH